MAGWRLCSTRESIAAELPSVTAVVESVVAVALALWLSFHLGAYYPLLPGVFVAPLVLLRSDESVDLGVRWFGKWERSGPIEAFWSSSKHLRFAVRTGIGALLAYFFTRWLLLDLVGWQRVVGTTVIGWATVSLSTGVAALIAAMTRTVVLGQSQLAALGGSQVPEATGATVGIIAAIFPNLEIATLAAVAVGAGATGPLVGSRVRAAPAHIAVPITLLLGVIAAAGGVAVWGWPGTLALFAVGGTVLGSALGVLLVSLVIRIGATLRHPWIGLKSLPRNFRRLVFCTSPCQRPELVPGLEAAGSAFTFDSFRAQFLGHNDLVGRFISIALALAWFGPAWSYRFFLKSTSWFWAALAYVGSESKKTRDPELYIRETLDADWRTLARYGAWATILAFAIVNGIAFLASPEGREASGQPVPTWFAMFVLFSSSTVPLWQLAGFLATMIALIHWYAVQHFSIRWYYAIDKKDATLADQTQSRFAFIEKCARVGTLLQVFYWGCNGGHLILTANSQLCLYEMDPGIHSVAVRIYGKYVPPACTLQRDARPAISSS